MGLYLRLKGVLGHYNESLTCTDLRLQLMLQTRVSYTVFVARQRYQKFWDGRTMKFTSPLGGIQQTQTGALETAAKSVTPCFAFD